MINKKYGRLTVLQKGKKHKGHTYYLCLCSCGQKKEIRKDALIKKRTVSCGCYQKEVAGKRSRKDVSGVRFGRLTVTKEQKNVNKRIEWKCLCECGNFVWLKTAEINRKNQLSCGCYKKEQSSKRWRGEKNPRYNPSLNDKDRKTRRGLQRDQLKKWAKTVYKKYHYKCLICKSSRKLNAHHLDNWSDFPKKRFSIENGVCLCESCHRRFHNEYGMNCTQQDFEEFILCN